MGGWISSSLRNGGPLTFTSTGTGVLRRAATSGLVGLSGWWSGVVGGDIDEDGDIDYVVSNAGLNTKYHADAEHPVRLFRGDFDGTGNQRLVEAKYERGILLPERGKSCSTAAIPLLSKRFATYRGVRRRRVGRSLHKEVS